MIIDMAPFSVKSDFVLLFRPISAHKVLILRYRSLNQCLTCCSHKCKNLTLFLVKSVMLFRRYFHQSWWCTVLLLYCTVLVLCVAGCFMHRAGYCDVTPCAPSLLALPRLSAAGMLATLAPLSSHSGQILKLRKCCPETSSANL